MSYAAEDNDSFDGTCPSCGQRYMQPKIASLKAERDEWFTVARDIKQQLADAQAEIATLSRKQIRMKGDIDMLQSALKAAYDRLTQHGIDIHGQ